MPAGGFVAWGSGRHSCGRLALAGRALDGLLLDRFHVDRNDAGFPDSCADPIREHTVGGRHG